MVYHGRVKDGRIELDEAVPLPEGTAVEVVVAPGAESRHEPTLYDELKDVVGILDDLPADAATNMDHYLYGHPRP